MDPKSSKNPSLGVKLWCWHLKAQVKVFGYLPILLNKAKSNSKRKATYSFAFSTSSQQQSTKAQ